MFSVHSSSFQYSSETNIATVECISYGQGEELGKTNAHYTDISQYRDVESLNYYEILLS